MFLKKHNVKGSLSKRITLFSFIGIILITIIMVIAIMWAFNQSMHRTIGNQLGAFNDLLIASTVIQDGQVVVNNTEILSTIPRYWQVTVGKNVIAKSPLLKGKVIPRADKPVFMFTDKDGTKILVSTVTVQFPHKTNIVYAFGMQREIVQAFIKGERKQFYLMLLAVVMLIVPALLLLIKLQLNTMLRPLSYIQRHLKEVQNGDNKRLGEELPDEILPLAKQINSLLDYSEQMIMRYRAFASNLSHALKTPLSALLNEAAKNTSPLAHLVKERVAVMQGLIDRNLVRVKISGSVDILHAKCDVASIIKRIATSFGKLYNKQVEVVQEHPFIHFKGDENDAYELFGNIIENACKYSKHYVQVTIRSENNQVIVVIEDDGPGIIASQRLEVLKRGKRLDETKPGEGIGLSVVQDIVSLYNGTITLEDSLLGGLKVTLLLPAS